MKFHIPNQYRFHILFFLCLFFVFLYFSQCIKETHISFLFRFFSSIADAALLTLPVIFLPRKVRFLILPYFLLIILIVYVNLLYYRNFGDLLPSTSYTLRTWNEPVLLQSALSSFRWWDMILVLLFLAPCIYLIFYPDKIDSGIKYSNRWSFFSFLIIFIGAFTIVFIGAYRRTSINNNVTSVKEVLPKIYENKNGLWKNYYHSQNFSFYIFEVLKNLRITTIKLNKEDRNYIKTYLENKNQINKYINCESGTLTDKRNLIFIIVESLPYKVIESDNFKHISPTLFSLKNDSSVITLKSDVLAGYGRSSDAQFIYNTGLLPLKNEAVAESFSLKDYPALPKALNRPSIEIIGENKVLWYHGNTTRSYGFNDLIHSIAPNGTNQDSLIFEKAAAVLRELPTPFFSLITTISMHDPYEESKVDRNMSTKLPRVNDKRDREYLQRLNHFDRNLNRFLQSLKDSGLYENSVIFILGDHEIRESTVSEMLHDNYIPVFIINSQHIHPLRKTITQLDIFPTVLNIFNTNYKYKDMDYSGLGISIFQDSIYYKPTEEDYNISNMIIRGDL